MCSEFGNKARGERADSQVPAALLAYFRKTFKQGPVWAWPFVPSIPLVGRKYEPRVSLLIYASAENLTWLNKEPAPERFRTDDAWNRYRAHYEAVGRPANTFFPEVGIQPVSDGGLLAAGRFVAERLSLPKNIAPRSFLENIAISNWCKFSIRTEQGNQDYLADVEKLTNSLPFVTGELTELQPAVVMLPNAVWRHQVLATAMWGASPRTCFLPVPQFNSTVVNCHLGKWHGRGQELRQRFAGEPLGAWMRQLHRVSEQNAWRYIAALEARCSAEQK